MSNGQQEASVEETVDTDTQDLEAVETQSTLDEASEQIDELKATERARAG